MPEDEEQQQQEQSSEIAAELERTRVALRQANREAAERRKKLEELEAAEELRRKSAMDESERLKIELQEAKSEAERAREQARETQIRAAFVAEAAKAGVAHPEDVYLLADRSTVDLDDDGNVSGVADAVKRLVDAGRVPLTNAKRTSPNLDGGAGGGERSKIKVQLTEEQLRIAKAARMTPEQYAVRLSELKTDED